MYGITIEVSWMGRPRKTIPSLCRHKASGQAVIYVGGATIYLGPWGSPKSVEEYGRTVAGEKKSRSKSGSPDAISMSTSAARYVAYRRSEMPLTSGEPHAIEVALADAVKAIGDIPVNSVGPPQLIRWRDDMVKRGLSLSTINKRTNYLLIFVRWLSVMGIVPSANWTNLKAVERLKPGRSQAKQPKKVGPVEWEHVEACLPHFGERMRDLVLVLAHTGARAGEIVSMTPSQISDRVYRPAKHKTASRGHAREIPLGPQAWSIVARRMEGLGPDDRVFGSLHVSSLSHEVAKACVKADVPKWTPHQLRHRAATIVVSKYGIAAARSLLGHASLAMTSRYAKPDLSEAKRAVEEIG